MTKSLLNSKQRAMHPRRQVKTLRRMAQLAMNKKDLDRAQQAIDEMKALNVEHDLGFPV
jgi:hypothetical protein